jgi:hypothetical protein
MKKLFGTTASLAVLVGAMATASAKEGDFSVYFSLGQGALYDTYQGGFFNAGPFNFELMAAKEAWQGIEINGGFMFGIDTQATPARVDNPMPGQTTTSKAKYLGFRPGVRLFLGDDRGQNYGGYFRPYLRAAFPIEIKAQGDTLDANGAPTGQPSKTIVNVGLLVGGGLEYRWKHVGIFVEVIVEPFFVDYYMPIEGRVGVAAHF